MLLGWSVMHVQRSVKSVRRKAKRFVFITFKEFDNASAFLNRTEREDIVIYQDDHTLYLLC